MSELVRWGKFSKIEMHDMWKQSALNHPDQLLESPRAEAINLYDGLLLPRWPDGELVCTVFSPPKPS